MLWRSAYLIYQEKQLRRRITERPASLTPQLSLQPRPERQGCWQQLTIYPSKNEYFGVDVCPVPWAVFIEKGFCLCGKTTNLGFGEGKAEVGVSLVGLG